MKKANGIPLTAPALKLIFENPEFVQGIEDSWEPSFICTDVAAMVHTLIGPQSTKIWGFSAEGNPKASFFSDGPEPDPEEGHHFAVVADRYIVDPWLFTVNFQGGTLMRSVFDLQDTNDRELVEYFYGDARQWVRLESEEKSAIESSVESFEELTRGI